MLKTASKFLQPISDRNTRIATYTQKEKIEYIKEKYNLTHGKGKRKRKYKWKNNSLIVYKEMRYIYMDFNIFEYIEESVEFFDDFELADKSAFMEWMELPSNKKVKTAKRLLSEAKRESNKKKAEQAIKLLKEVRKEAELIDDDGVLATLVRLFIEPWPMLVGEWISAGKLTFRELSRSQALKYIDNTIKSAERFKNKL